MDDPLINFIIVKLEHCMRRTKRCKTELGIPENVT